MGFLLCALLWSVVFLEEVERTPADEWDAHGAKTALALRRTRRRPAFLLALVLGGFFAAFEIRLVLLGRSTFNALQALGLAAIIWAAYAYAVSRKGRT
jgi:hypothetical protein